MLLLAVLGLLAANAAAASVSHKLTDSGDPCHGVECRAGRECLVSGGVAQCLCVTSCPDHYSPVCGSNGQSYSSHCLLHQRACVTNNKISISYTGLCVSDLLESKSRRKTVKKTAVQGTSEKKTKKIRQKSWDDVNLKEELAVCYGPQRDALRESIIERWQKTMPQQPWYAEGMTYREGLWGHFFTCDTDRDFHLRPDELLDCCSDVKLLPRAGQDLTLTRTLCVDAMLDDADRNKDWQLDFEEFSRMLDPRYKPADKNCSLEGLHYSDGAEVDVECNHCVCATGNWVCATHDCPEKKDTSSTSSTLSTSSTSSTSSTTSRTDGNANKNKNKPFKVGDFNDLSSYDDYEEDEQSDDALVNDKTIDGGIQHSKHNRMLNSNKKKHNRGKSAKKYFDFVGESEPEHKTTEFEYETRKSNKPVNEVVPHEKENKQHSNVEEEEENEIQYLGEYYNDLVHRSSQIREQMRTLQDDLRKRRYGKVSGAHKLDQKQKVFQEALMAKANHKHSSNINDIWHDDWKEKIQKRKHGRSFLRNNHL